MQLFITKITMPTGKTAYRNADDTDSVAELIVKALESGGSVETVPFELLPDDDLLGKFLFEHAKQEIHLDHAHLYASDDSMNDDDTVDATIVND